MRKTILLSFVLATFSFCGAYAQGFRVPEKYSFDNPDAYHKYDKDIVKCANWLEHTPPGDDDEKVKRAGRFMLEWMSGAPYIRFATNSRIDVYLDDAPQYKIYYMAGWARYALEANLPKPDKRMCMYAGLKMVIKVYKAANSEKKNENIEELIKLDNQSKLKAWVDDRV